MTNQKSQQAKRRKFLDALVAGDKISKLDALKRFHLFNSGDAVHVFRREGWPVQTEMVERKGERYAVYFIPKEV